MNTLSTINDDPDLPSFVKKNTEVETYYNIKQLMNHIRMLRTIKESMSPSKRLISIDTESFEFDHSRMTEFGWCIFNVLGEIFTVKHYIVRENRKLCNGRHVPNHKFNFNFGDSMVKNLKKIKEELRKDLDASDYMVGQGIQNDLRDLTKRGIDIGRFQMDDDDLSLPTKRIIDTQDLFSGCFLAPPISLEKGLKKLEIPSKYLHNAGNDAYYTMKYFLKLISIFNYDDEKYNKILKIQIPDSYSDEKYYEYRLLKKQERERQRLLQQQEQGNN